MKGIVCKEDCKEATGICANASPGQVWLINGRDYLVVGKFENLLLDGMSPIAFRLLNLSDLFPTGKGFRTHPQDF